MSRFWIATVLVLGLLAGVARAQDDDLTLLLQRGQLRRAAMVAQKRLGTHPDDAVALSVLARVRAEDGRQDEATKLAERAIAAAPNSADAHYALALVCGMHAQRAGLVGKVGLAKRFKKEAEAALALDSSHAEALEGMIEFHRQAPGIVGGDKKKAAEFTDRLMRVDPTRGWIEKAGIASDEKDSVAAERDLRQAVDLGQPSAKLALANYLSRRWRKPDESARLAHEVVEAEPWRAGAWALLAMSQASQRQYGDLDATLAQTESAVPGNLGPHYQAARVLIVEKGDAARAEALLRRYLDAEPEIGTPSHAAARWRLALALEREGRKPEAISELEAALKLDPKLDAAKSDLRRLRK
jgi:tetratricopeptide (TPR) repeat protein